MSHLLFNGFLSQLVLGAWVAVKVACCALLLGLVLGLLGAWGRLSKHKLIFMLATSLTNIIRGLPELLVLFFIYFGSTWLLSMLLGTYIGVSSFWAGVIALALIFASYATETFRGAFLTVSKGEIESATACGMTAWQCFYRIILPQLFRYALPGLGNLWFVLLKDTALISLIGAADLMRAAQNATAYTREPFTFYFAAALIYLLLTSISMLGIKKLSQKYKEFA